VITTARESASAEMSSRVRRYTITMAFRTACFISMIFVPGVLKWVLFFCALVLPYVAVLFANQANRRSDSKWARAAQPQTNRAALGTGHEDEVDEVVDAEPGESSNGRYSDDFGTNDSRPDGRVA